jgi:hypothetical protein
MKYAVYVKGEFAALCDSLEECKVFKDRYFLVSVYYAHTEKKGCNTIIVNDALLRKSDGTPF